MYIYNNLLLDLQDQGDWEVVVAVSPEDPIRTAQDQAEDNIVPELTNFFNHLKNDKSAGKLVIYLM